ncbi:PHB depolymerase family esterase [Chromobacterium sp. IIBBL 290-4]|uniref:alpha/beta hydrolase family esterase n=1 Tax=Chromobacterium sp. IIBBL 290-4 TaxID=2953890 RepID=UPI0020B8B0B5|nr:PHB depolymerase family esterase [Chromobacterium sp. IIBBL 290-4]UTH73125.1 prolyl oligopeptidase family serine peptidase [Chromobacterium sp. IIBBL 290-4]
MLSGLRISLSRLALAAAPMLASGASLLPMTMDRPEGVRSYVLAMPETMPAGLRPLVILLHGHGGSARQLLGQGLGAAPLSAWLKIADREGLLLIAPDGVKGGDGRQGWHDCRADAVTNPKVDDVAFLDALIDQAVAQRRADPLRIYLMGMSNGGMMTLRMAAERGARLAAFATVGASMARRSECAPAAHPLPGLIVAGTADPVVPFRGGEVSLLAGKGRGEVISVNDTVARWRKLDGEDGQAAVTETLPHLRPEDPTLAVWSRWGGSRGLPLWQLTIQGGGHVEPSIQHRIGVLYARVAGRQNGDVESAELAWSLFRDSRRLP